MAVEVPAHEDPQADATAAPALFAELQDDAVQGDGVVAGDGAL